MSSPVYCSRSASSVFPFYSPAELVPHRAPSYVLYHRPLCLLETHSTFNQKWSVSEY